MAQYKISGVWKNANNVITHYAFHKVDEKGVATAQKLPKTEAIALLEKPENSAITRVWNYKQTRWSDGEGVEVVNGETGKYLRSDPDDTLTDNLAHLIDFEWIIP